MTETLAHGLLYGRTQREQSNDDLQKSLHPRALYESSLGMGRV